MLDFTYFLGLIMKTLQWSFCDSLYTQSFLVDNSIYPHTGCIHISLITHTTSLNTNHIYQQLTYPSSSWPYISSSDDGAEYFYLVQNNFDWHFTWTTWQDTLVHVIVSYVLFTGKTLSIPCAWFMYGQIFVGSICWETCILICFIIDWSSLIWNKTYHLLHML